MKHSFNILLFPFFKLDENTMVVSFERLSRQITSLTLVDQLWSKFLNEAVNIYFSCASCARGRNSWKKYHRSVIAILHSYPKNTIPTHAFETIILTML